MAVNRHPTVISFIRYHRITWVVLALFFANLVMGLMFLNEGIFHHDGIVLARAVEGTYATGHLQPATKGRYGCVLVNCILYAPFYIAGLNADLCVRFSSVLFHALSIAAFFLLIYELSGNWMQAFAGGCLLSVTPFYFSPNTYGKEHGMSMFFFLLALFFVLRGAKRKNLMQLALSSFLFGFSLSVRESLFLFTPIYFLLYLSPHISLVPFKMKIPQEKWDVKALCAVGAPFVIIASLIFFSYLMPVVYRELFVRDYATVNFLGFYSLNLPTAFKDLGKSVPLLCFAMAAIGIVRMMHKQDIFLPVLLCLWFLGIFYFGNVLTYVPRFLDAVIVPVYIAATYALKQLYDKDKTIAVVMVVFFVTSMFSFMYPWISSRHQYNGAKQFALFVKEKTQDNALIISMDDAAFLEYYGLRKTLPHPMTEDHKEMALFLRKVAVTLANGIPVYLTNSSLSYDSKQVFRNLLLTNFNLTVIGSKLYEDYHRPDLGFTKFDETLYEIHFKFK